MSGEDQRFSKFPSLRSLCFLRLAEEFDRRERRELKGRQAVGQTGALTCRVKTSAFPSSLPGFLWLTWGGYLE